MSTISQPCHVVHLLYRFAAGGLENVLVQLVNGLPRERFRHTIIALTEADSAFAARIERSDVEIISLHKAPGQPFRLYPRMYQLLRQLRPDVVHSCNLAALEFMPVAALAGVPRRIHAEHGWDTADPDGRNWRYRLLRKIYKLFVHEFVVVSTELHRYLADVIDVPLDNLHLIENGVDTQRFRPAQVHDIIPAGFPFQRPQHRVVGTVGRLEPIKNQLLLVEAFIQLLNKHPELIASARLVIVGSGPLKETLIARMQSAGYLKLLWLPGARSDIPEVLRSFDCFVLPSLAEGTSCTLQEAMATCLPIIATDVGGNARLLKQGELGDLVKSGDCQQMTHALWRCLAETPVLDEFKQAESRAFVEQNYSMRVMLDRYNSLFRGK